MTSIFVDRKTFKVIKTVQQNDNSEFNIDMLARVLAEGFIEYCKQRGVEFEASAQVKEKAQGFS